MPRPELSREEVEKIIKAIEEKMKQTSHWEVLIIYNDGTMDIKSTSRDRIREKNEK